MNGDRVNVNTHPLQFYFQPALLFFLLAVFNDPLIPAEIRGKGGQNNASRQQSEKDIESQGLAFQIFCGETQKRTWTDYC